MKTTLLVAALALVAFLADALGDNEWTSLPVQTFRSLNEATNEGRIHLAVHPSDRRSQPRLAGVSVTEAGEDLPTRLPIGTPDRDYIVQQVAGRGLMNVYVGVGYRTTSGSWTEITTGKAPTNGYANYDALIADAIVGIEGPLASLRTKTNYLAGSDVYGILSVDYFNDMQVDAHGMGLWITNPVGPRESIDARKIVLEFAVDKPTVIEQVIIPLPALDSLFMEVLKDGQTSTMSWTSSGVQLSSTWPRTPPERTTTGYLYINGWVAKGNYPLRVVIRAEDGEERAYTEYGDQLTDPVLRMISGHELGITVAKGATVQVSSSADLLNWSEYTLLERVQERSFTLQIGSGVSEEMKFFRATAR